MKYAATMLLLATTSLATFVTLTLAGCSVTKLEGQLNKDTKAKIITNKKAEAKVTVSDGYIELYTGKEE